MDSLQERYSDLGHRLSSVGYKMLDPYYIQEDVSDVYDFVMMYRDAQNERLIGQVN